MDTEPTASEDALAQALRQEGIRVEPHPYDGHKHVDLRSEEAKVDIEVDGIQHVVSAKQINRDLDRSYHSHNDGYETLHVRNTDVRFHLRQVARAIGNALRYREWRMRHRRKRTQ